MPIQVGAEIRRMDDNEFKARAYEVMRHAFDVEHELGRLFHEKIGSTSRGQSFASRRFGKENEKGGKKGIWQKGK